MEKELPLKIGICDDEREIREDIARRAHLLFADAQTLMFADGKELLAYAGGLDILFLDIQMEPVDGMEAAKRLRAAGSDVTIIFVTALEEYVYQAFDVGAFHYLVKPFSQAKFYEVLRRAAQERKQRTERFASSPYAGQKTEGDGEGLVIKKGGKTRRVLLCGICWLEVFNRKIVLHTADEEIEFYGKLSEMETRLGEDFVRCHRAYLVNMRYIDRYDACGITLENGETIPLARQKYAEFVKRYLGYMQRLKERNG